MQWSSYVVVLTVRVSTQAELFTASLLVVVVVFLYHYYNILGILSCICRVLFSPDITVLFFYVLYAWNLLILSVEFKDLKVELQAITNMLATGETVHKGKF